MLLGQTRPLARKIRKKTSFSGLRQPQVSLHNGLGEWREGGVSLQDTGHNQHHITSLAGAERTVLLTLVDLLGASPRDGKWVEREDVAACRHPFLLLSAEICLVLSLCLDRLCLYFQRTGTF